MPGPSDEILFPELASNHCGDAAQQLISDVAPGRVADRFEIININDGQGQRSMTVPGPEKLDFGFTLPGTCVQQTCLQVNTRLRYLLGVQQVASVENQRRKRQN